MYHLGLARDLLDMTPSVKEQANKQAIIKSKNICSSKDTAKKMKRQPQSRRESLQSMYLIKNLCIDYKKPLSAGQCGSVD